ncbi:D-hexose-6-phosphate mutarotase [Pseudomaricurvus sp.]|uniref:D-hexose-6-phosphate mutarotase n=1 Tax=Pseudomaricurvus sp. TaxID=2004510 RepID=UPI003F6AE12C
MSLDTHTQTDSSDILTPELAQLLSECPHLQLSDSQTVFPTCQNEDALPILLVKNAFCSASVAFQGAQLLTHQTHSDSDLVWLSPKAIFKTGKAIRGGIPLCLPWFGPHSSDPDKPQHGFARNRLWTLVQAQATDTGTTKLTWELTHSGGALFEGCFRASLTMTLGSHIELTLNVTNTGADSFPLSWALHSYHPVADVKTAHVTGLDQIEFLDNTDLQDSESYPMRKRRKTQSGNVQFAGEVDRVYVSAPKKQQLISSQRCLTINADNCHSAIVWNPGELLAANMADVGADYYREFVCLERGNTADNTLQLSPGETHTASLCIDNDSKI